MKFRMLTTYKLVMTIILNVLLCGLSVQAGPVADMIANAREARAQRHPTEVSRLEIQVGLREIGPSGVNEALDILRSQKETEDVLEGLLRGLAIIRESADPSISRTICDYAANPDFSPQLRAQARESARIRCPTDPSACRCQDAATFPQ